MRAGTSPRPTGSATSSPPAASCSKTRPRALAGSASRGGVLPRSGSGRGFRSLPHNRAKGADAERRGVVWLRSQGYRVLAVNVTNRGGELDVVAADGDTLCFIEIKARATDRFGPAILAVDAAKRRKLARAASAYLATRPWDGPCRFDVLGMDLVDGAFEYTLLRDAFRVE